MRGFYVLLAFLATTPAGAAFFFVSPTAGISFLGGGSLAIVNVAFIQSIWSRILLKKSVASIIGLIVLKYTLLIGVLYRAANSSEIALGWFMAGTGMVVLASVGRALAVGRNSGSSF